MLRMARQARVVDPLDARLALQPFGQGQGTGAVRLHADTQGFQALEEQPGVERAEGRSGGAEEADHFLHLLAATGDHPAHAPALPVDVLGRGVDHHVRTELQRLLQRRRAEAVVHRQQRTLGVGDLGQRGDIHQLGQRVGWRLDEEQLGIRLARRLPGREIAQRRIVDLDTEALEVLVEQADGRAEHAARDQHVVAGAAQAHHQGEDRRHARRRGHRLLGSFEGGDALLEGAYRGVGVARIDVARHFAGEPRGRVGGGAEDVAGSGEQRLAVLALRRPPLPGANRQGVEGRAFQVAVETPGIPVLSHAALPFVSRCTDR